MKLTTALLLIASFSVVGELLRRNLTLLYKVDFFLILTLSRCDISKHTLWQREALFAEQ